MGSDRSISSHGESDQSLDPSGRAVSDELFAAPLAFRDVPMGATFEFLPDAPDADIMTAVNPPTGVFKKVGMGGLGGGIPGAKCIESEDPSRIGWTPSVMANTKCIRVMVSEADAGVLKETPKEDEDTISLKEDWWWMLGSLIFVIMLIRYLV